MIDYIGTLPMWVQLIIVFVTLILIISGIGAMLYRLIRFGVKAKVGPIEIDATDDSEEVKP